MFKYQRFIIYYTSTNFMCVFFIKTEHFITTTINNNMEKHILFTYILCYSNHYSFYKFYWVNYIKKKKNLKMIL